MSSGMPLTAGILFGPTATGKHYVSVFYHRCTARTIFKRCWASSVAPVAEFGIFSDADRSGWSGNGGHYWGIRPGGDILGTEGERMAKFPRPSNGNDPWHGYPISAAENVDDAPPVKLVVRWIDDGVISETLGKRILRFKI
jgi:hypothetical protein